MLLLLLHHHENKIEIHLCARNLLNYTKLQIEKKNESVANHDLEKFSIPSIRENSILSTSTVLALSYYR